MPLPQHLLIPFMISKKSKHSLLIQEKPKKDNDMRNISSKGTVVKWLGPSGSQAEGSSFDPVL